MTFAESLAVAAPYYNLALVVIVLCLYYKLFTTSAKKSYLLPWKVMFFAVLVYIVEELITVLRAAGLLNITLYVNGFFELVIISLFIYTLLLQKQHIES